MRSTAWLPVAFRRTLFAVANPAGTAVRLVAVASGDEGSR